MTKIEYLEAQGDNDKYNDMMYNQALWLSRTKLPRMSTFRLKVNRRQDVESGIKSLNDQD